MNSMLKVLSIFVLVNLAVADEVEVLCARDVSGYWGEDYLHACYSGNGEQNGDPHTVLLNAHDTIKKASKNAEFEALAFYVPSKLHYFPKGLKAAFPKVKALYFNDQPMTSVCGSDLEEFGTDLVYLHLIYIKIKYLAADTFKHNPNMKYIRISGSELKAVEPEFFKYIPKMKYLKEVHLDSNPCINQKQDAPNINDVWTHTCEATGQCGSHAVAGYSASKVVVTISKEVEETWHHIGKILGCYSGTKDGKGTGTTVLHPEDFIDESFHDTKFAGIAFYLPSRVYYIPRGLKKAMVNLKALYFYDQPMQSVSAGELEQFGASLEYFHVEKGHFSYLTKNPFKYNPNIKSIKIEGSYLVAIETEFFKNVAKLTHLQEVQLLKMSCIDQTKVAPNINELWSHSCPVGKPRICSYDD